eukprot:1157376-Pelagomonas_calceolata.AAC.2
MLGGVRVKGSEREYSVRNTCARQGAGAQRAGHLCACIPRAGSRSIECEPPVHVHSEGSESRVECRVAQAVREHSRQGVALVI